MQPIYAFLFGSVPASFETDLPLDQAVERLREATARPPGIALTHEGAAGTVTAQHVSLYRSIPLFANSFKPIFAGRFCSEGGRTFLRGVFTMHWLAKAFMTFWFGFCLFWTLLATVMALAKPQEVWFFPIFGLGMMLAGFAIVQLSTWLARNDTRYLSTVIENALRQDSLTHVDFGSSLK
jgi:hypothetical protein